MGTITNIIVHCSASSWGDVRSIRQWHTDKGWKDIGYHFVILNGRILPDLYLDALDGATCPGRVLDEDGTLFGDEVGAHALGYNATSIGVCLIGGETGDDFTVKQYQALRDLILNLCIHYRIDIEKTLGHYETPQSHGKTCPNFDMRGFREVLKYERHRMGAG